MGNGISRKNAFDIYWPLIVATAPYFKHTAHLTYSLWAHRIVLQIPNLEFSGNMKQLINKQHLVWLAIKSGKIRDLKFAIWNSKMKSSHLFSLTEFIRVKLDNIITERMKYKSRFTVTTLWEDLVLFSCTKRSFL